MRGNGGWTVDNDKSNWDWSRGWILLDLIGAVFTVAMGAFLAGYISVKCF